MRKLHVALITALVIAGVATTAVGTFAFHDRIVQLEKQDRASGELVTLAANMDVPGDWEAHVNQAGIFTHQSRWVQMNWNGEVTSGVTVIKDRYGVRTVAVSIADAPEFTIRDGKCVDPDPAFASLHLCKTLDPTTWKAFFDKAVGLAQYHDQNI